MTTTYAGFADRFTVLVYEGGSRSRLPHHAVNSPAGFAWGYHGSGPADLARDLFAHVVDTDIEDIEPFAFRVFLDGFVARLDSARNWSFTREQIRSWIDSQEAIYGDGGFLDRAGVSA